ncbi:hypothetical protein MYX07_02460 [Patescibacteria group bacterium AH-259-L07]|nr:hypothetical protein [Patescibacteria group bacterium AH-259-L07]
MAYIHKQLAAGRWYELTLIEQMANIGADIGRALKWQKKDKKLMQSALERGLELFDLTIADPRWRHRLKEILRMREIVCDYFIGGNAYNSTPGGLEKYFLVFAIAARLNR